MVRFGEANLLVLPTYPDKDAMIHQLDVCVLALRLALPTIINDDRSVHAEFCQLAMVREITFGIRLPITLSTSSVKESERKTFYRIVNRTIPTLKKKLATNRDGVHV